MHVRANGWRSCASVRVKKFAVIASDDEPDTRATRAFWGGKREDGGEKKKISATRGAFQGKNTPRARPGHFAVSRGVAQPLARWNIKFASVLLFPRETFY